MKRIIKSLFSILFLLPILTSCNTSSFKEVTFPTDIEGVSSMVADKYIEQDGNIKYGCQKGEDITITFTLAPGYNAGGNDNFKIYVNKEKQKLSTSKVDNITSFYFTYSNVTSNLSITTSGELGRILYDVRVVPYYSSELTEEKRIISLKSANGIEPFVYGYKIIKQGVLKEDTLSTDQWCYYSEFYDKVASYNKDYYYGDIIEFYVKSCKLILDVGTYSYTTSSDLCRQASNINVDYPISSSFNYETSILTYSFVVTETKAIVMKKYGTNYNVTTHYTYDDSEYIITKTSKDNFYFTAFDIMDSNNKIITSLEDLATYSNKKIVIEIKDKTPIKLASSLLDNLYVNGENIPKENFTLVNNILTINNLKMPYEYIGEETYINSCEVGRNYVVSFKNAKKYMENDSNYSYIDYKSLVEQYKNTPVVHDDRNDVINNGEIGFDNKYYWNNDEEITFNLVINFNLWTTLTMDNIKVVFTCVDGSERSFIATDPMEEKYAEQNGIKVYKNDKKYYTFTLLKGFPAIEDITVSVYTE